VIVLTLCNTAVGWFASRVVLQPLESLTTAAWPWRRNLDARMRVRIIPTCANCQILQRNRRCAAAAGRLTHVSPAMSVMSHGFR
jgi:hypothetical protein